MSFMVHNPLLFLGIGIVFAAVGVAFRKTRPRSVRLLYLAAGAWMAAALWEIRIMTVQPDANIRVDLLLIIPILVLLSAWAMLHLLLHEQSA